MATPRAASMQKLKRIARYLLRYPRGVIRFVPAEDGGAGPLEVYTDSDWAGCPRTRKSTSGGMLFVDGGLMKSWSSTQGPIALSSGEAELVALVKAATEGLAMLSLMADLGWTRRMRVWTDSAAAKAIASRSGLGKTRHIETKFLWVQEAVKNERFGLAKVPGQENPADWLTKPGSANSRTLDMQSWGLAVMKTEEVEERKGPRRRRWADIMEEEENKKDLYSNDFFVVGGHPVRDPSEEGCRG